MDTIATHINELKKLTIKRDIDFSTPFDYFMSHFAEDPAGRKFSIPYTENTNFFQAMLTPIVRKLRGVLKIQKLLLMHIKGHDFIHGVGFLSNGCPLVFYYFQEIHVGLAAITFFDSGTNYFRLSGFISDKPLEKGTTFSSKGNSTLH